MVVFLIPFTSGGYRSGTFALGKQRRGSFYRHGTSKQIGTPDTGATGLVHTFLALALVSLLRLLIGGVSEHLSLQSHKLSKHRKFVWNA